MKGLYVIWPDFDLIDKAIEAGIDTLLVSCYNFPNDGKEVVYFDSYETTMSVFSRYKNKIKCLLVPSMIRQWVPIPTNQQFVKDGINYECSPCPTNNIYIQSRLCPAISLYKEGIIDGIVVDSEQYAGKINYLNEKTRCECLRCSSSLWKEQWEIQKFNLYMMGMSKVGEVGTMPYNNWWNFWRYSNGGLNGTIFNTTQIRFYDESFYTGYSTKRVFDVWWNRIKSKYIHGVDYKVSSGVWLEVLNEENFFYALSKLSKSRVIDGWWIYSQKRMTKNSRITDETAKKERATFGMYEESLVDDNFFIRLKELCKNSN